TVTVDRTTGQVVDVVVGDKGDPARRETLALSPGQIEELWALGGRSEAVGGAPQDVEWAYAAGRLHVLQCRPVTTMPGTGDGEVRIWDNSNIIESYGEVTAPLTFSFARHMYGRLYREYCGLLGVPRK